MAKTATGSFNKSADLFIRFFLICVAKTLMDHPSFKRILREITVGPTRSVPGFCLSESKALC